MSLYGRNARIQNENETQSQPQSTPATATTPSRKKDEKGGMRVNGFQQVLEMLQVADPEFRDSLLKRIAAEDPKLAKRLTDSLYV